MKRLVYLLSAVMLAVLGGTASSQVPLPPRAKIYSQPVPPPRELLDRLNLKMSYRIYVPMDGRRDGLVTVQLSGRDLYVQTRSGLVTLIDAESGEALWRQRVGRPYVSEHALTFNSREVYVINNVYLYALDRLTGMVNWYFRLPEGVAAPPVADENMIFIASQTGRLTAYLLPRLDLLASSPAGAAGGSGVGETREQRYGRVAPHRADMGGTSTTISHLTKTASEASTAELPAGPQPVQAWSEVTSLRLELPLVLTPDRILIPAPSGNVQALSKLLTSTTTTTSSYRFPVEAEIRVPAGYFDGAAYIAAQDGNLYALETSGGRLLWRFTIGVPIIRRPVVTDEDVYLVASRLGMTRIDRATGLPSWRIPRNGGLVESNASANFYLASNPKYVYALDASGCLLVIDRRRGVTLSGFDSTDFVYPISNDVTDRIYLAANNGLIVCLHDREYPRAIRHRQREEESVNPIRLRLDERINEALGREIPLEEMLESWTKRYPPLRFRIEETAFRAANRESPARMGVKMPAVRDKRLGDVIKDVLAPINCTFEIIGDTVVLVPLPAPPER
ncbi:MAG: outer membrane protein assembly factor BamB family protein [Gemmataceae bacterium]